MQDMFLKVSDEINNANHDTHELGERERETKLRVLGFDFLVGLVFLL